MKGTFSMGTAKSPRGAARNRPRPPKQPEEPIRRHGFRETAPRAEYVTHAEIVADAAYQAAKAAAAAAIVVFTSSGSSARLISRFRPPVPIFAFTPSEQAARALNIVYGVRPVIAPHVTSTDEMMAQMDRILLEHGWVKPRDSVVFVAGQPIGRPGTTNLLKLHRVGETR